MHMGKTESTSKAYLLLFALKVRNVPTDGSVLTAQFEIESLLRSNFKFQRNILTVGVKMWALAWKRTYCEKCTDCENNKLRPSHQSVLTSKSVLTVKTKKWAHIDEAYLLSKAYLLRKCEIEPMWTKRTYFTKRTYCQNLKLSPWIRSVLTVASVLTVKNGMRPCVDKAYLQAKAYLLRKWEMRPMEWKRTY